MIRDVVHPEGCSFFIQGQERKNPRLLAMGFSENLNFYSFSGRVLKWFFRIG